MNRQDRDQNLRSLWSSSATWLSTSPVPDPQPPLKYSLQPFGATSPMPHRWDGTHARQEMHRVGPMAWRYVALDVQEELGLVARVISRLTPDRRRGREMCHADSDGQRVQSAGADEFVQRVGGVVA